MNLDNKTLTDLRSMAQAFDLAFTFADAKQNLIDKITAAMQVRVEEIAAEPVPFPALPDDQRLRSVPPAKNLPREQVYAMLKPFFALGLQVTFPEADQWHMACGNKEDTGSLRMPLRVIMKCAVEQVR